MMKRDRIQNIEYRIQEFRSSGVPGVQIMRFLRVEGAKFPDRAQGIGSATP